LKIAICSPISLTNFSGAARFLIDVANLLSHRGHDVNVYALPFGPNKTISLKEVRSLLSGVTYHESRRISVAADVAYVNYTPLMWRRMKISGKKVAGLHTPLILPKQHLLQTLTHPHDAGYEWYAKTLGFAVLSPLLKVDLMLFDAVHIPMSGFSVFGQDRVYEIPLWIDIDKIPQDTPAKFEKFTVLFAGRKAWEKGWPTFHRISKSLRRMGYDFDFLCTGDGCNGVRGLGFLNDRELYDLYQRSHIVVYPSIADIFSLVILETAACSVPVITTPIDAHINQRFPMFYAKSPNDFIDAILHVYSLWMEQPDEYRMWCQNLRTNAQKYDVEKIFPRFERMLEETVSNRKPRSEQKGSAGWAEPRLAFCHNSEKTSKIQRIKELEWAAKGLKRSLGGLTLDIGGGKGYVGSLLEELGCNTIGLDIKPSFVKHMVKLGLPAVLADARKLPLRSSVFDQVTCFEMIEHVEKPEEVLKEIKRVLKDNGLAVLTTPIMNPVNSVIDFARGERTHISVIRLSDLLRIMQKHFPKVIHNPIMVLPIPPSLFSRYFWFDTRIFANHIWMGCEK